MMISKNVKGSVGDTYSTPLKSLRILYQNKIKLLLCLATELVHPDNFKQLLATKSSIIFS